MKFLLTKQDLAGLDYIPAARMDAFVNEINRIIKLKVAGQDDQVWTDFVNQYANVGVGTRRTGDTAARANV